VKDPKVPVGNTNRYLRLLRYRLAVAEVGLGSRGAESMELGIEMDF